jgi:hypothetical protein
MRAMRTPFNLRSMTSADVAKSGDLATTGEDKEGSAQCRWIFEVGLIGCTGFLASVDRPVCSACFGRFAAEG